MQFLRYDSERIRDELTELLNEQLNTLERETFGCVTEAELCEYEDRHNRINQLYSELVNRETAH